MPRWSSAKGRPVGRLWDRGWVAWHQSGKEANAKHIIHKKKNTSGNGRWMRNWWVKFAAATGMPQKRRRCWWHSWQLAVVTASWWLLAIGRVVGNAKAHNSLLWLFHDICARGSKPKRQRHREARMRKTWIAIARTTAAHYESRETRPRSNINFVMPRQ